MSARKITVLIVDDKQTNRAILSLQLARAGYEVAEAENGAKALEFLQQHACDVVLLDIMMPGMDGFAVLEEVRKIYKMTELPVIMATAVSGTQDIVRALDLGANDYVTKPLNLPVVLARIKTHLSLKQLTKQNEEFLSIASHDLKKPIALISDIVDVISEQYSADADLPGDLNEMIELIGRTASATRQTIEDFLQLRTIDEGGMSLVKQPTCLNDVVRAVVALNRDYAGTKRIQLTMDLEEDLEPVIADAGKIEHVIDNLVGNAIKFSDPGTGATVATYTQDESVFLEVRDEGPGIRAEVRDQVFVKYAKVGNRPTGGETSTGLGLAICKRLVDLHDGEIGVRNNGGAGATFWFRLPRHERGNAVGSAAGRG